MEESAVVQAVNNLWMACR